jgi:hypothetical protein
MQTMRAELLRKKRLERAGIRSEKLSLHKDFIEKRKQQLDQIALLCKIYHKKVKISFQTNSGEQFIETSLWMSTGQYVILNDGRFIPINSIIDISF